MSKLKDMEELIEGIVDINMKEYMREALTCCEKILNFHSFSEK